MASFKKKNKKRTLNSETRNCERGNRNSEKTESKQKQQQQQQQVLKIKTKC